MARLARERRHEASRSVGQTRRQGLLALLRVISAAVLIGVALGVVWVGSAVAAPGITAFDVTVTSSQAGGHPNVGVEVQFNNRLSVNQEAVEHPEGGCECQDARDLSVHFPEGFIGDPHSIPQCSLSDFALNECSQDTQVGVVFLAGIFESPQITAWEEKVGEVLGYASPIYNLEPHPGDAGEVGSIAPLLGAPIETSLNARTGSDYGLDAVTSGLFHVIPITRVAFYLWGDPAAAEHDRARFPLPHTSQQDLCLGTINDQVPNPEAPSTLFGPYGCHESTPSSAANVPYLENPTTCGGPLTTGVDLKYYDGSTVSAQAPWPAITGCDQLKFNPSASAIPTTEQTDTASGLNLDIKVPQTQSPSVPAPSEVRVVRTILPTGFSLTPGGADGKTACTDSALRFESSEEAECPEISKIGTSVLDSSALPGPIPGAIYIGQPLPNERFRLFLTADGFSTHVKLKGSVHLNQETGQIVTEFVNLPQSPFQEFDLHFFGSERGIFDTPTQCGSYLAEVTFLPWAAALPSQTSSARFNLTSGPGSSACPNGARPFTPEMQAGTPNNTAGVSTPLAIQLQRNDGNQFLSGLSVELPRGLIQSIRGVQECPESALATLSLVSHTGLLESQVPACPLSSQVGSISTGAGAGTHPIYNDGKVYLAGPYKGAPLSLVTVVPALGGPYDLGNVVVRVAVFVDTATGQVRAVSDPLPQILDGVVLRVRSLLLNFDRAGFNHTPTNCAPKAIEATVGGSEGAEYPASAYYQVANCKGLEYRPKLGFRLTGGLGRLGHPAISTVFTARPDEANTSRVVATLPSGELLDNAHFGTVCARAEYARGSCPPGSVVGRAELTTPLLDEPLSGPVYLRSATQGLPDLVAELKGQVELELVGHVSSPAGRFRTVFSDLPDAEVSTLKLDLLGGSRGLLQNSEGLCGAHKQVAVAMLGQNGKIIHTQVGLHPVCGMQSAQRVRAGHGKVVGG